MTKRNESVLVKKIFFGFSLVLLISILISCNNPNTKEFSAETQNPSNDPPQQVIFLNEEELDEFIIVSQKSDQEVEEYLSSSEYHFKMNGIKDRSDMQKLVSTLQEKKLVVFKDRSVSWQQMIYYPSTWSGAYAGDFYVMYKIGETRYVFYYKNVNVNHSGEYCESLEFLGNTFDFFHDREHGLFYSSHDFGDYSLGIVVYSSNFENIDLESFELKEFY